MNEKPVLGTLPEAVPSWYPLLVSLIKDIGFPVVVAGYLLFRLDGQIQNLIQICGGH